MCIWWAGLALSYHKAHLYTRSFGLIWKIWQFSQTLSLLRCKPISMVIYHTLNHIVVYAFFCVYNQFLVIYQATHLLISFRAIAMTVRNSISILNFTGISATVPLRLMSIFSPNGHCGSRLSRWEWYKCRQLSVKWPVLNHNSDSFY